MNCGIDAVETIHWRACNTFHTFQPNTAGTYKYSRYLQIQQVPTNTAGTYKYSRYLQLNVACCWHSSFHDSLMQHRFRFAVVLCLVTNSEFTTTAVVKTSEVPPQPIFFAMSFQTLCTKIKNIKYRLRQASSSIHYDRPAPVYTMTLVSTMTCQL